MSDEPEESPRGYRRPVDHVGSGKDRMGLSRSGLATLALACMMRDSRVTVSASDLVDVTTLPDGRLRGRRPPDPHAGAPTCPRCRKSRVWKSGERWRCRDCGTYVEEV